METTRRLGLTLPTEEEWEYAARAGTESVWWSGDTAPELQGIANVNDRNVAELDCGTRVIAAVTINAPSPWGFHNVHGNVSEWCRNRPYNYGTEPGSDPSTYLLRALRGGGKRKGPTFARSAAPNPVLHSVGLPDAGLRPARPVMP